MSDCPGCTQQRGDDGVWRRLGPHVEGCSTWESDATNRMHVLEHLERKAAEHRAAIADGCAPDRCDHPLDSAAEAGWRWFHEVTLVNVDQLIGVTRQEMRDLAADEPG